MRETETLAWVLPRGAPKDPGRADLVEKRFALPPLREDQVLVEPLYGCWEGNMTHALERSPVDICRLRGETEVVLGNAGVVRVLEPGAAVTDLAEGDVCVIIPIGEADENGYVRRVFAYDAPRTVGLMAKRTILGRRQLIALRDTRHSLLQWAAFSVRYATAWSNWIMAYGAWKLRVPDAAPSTTFVCGWGGGVSIAELTLAAAEGCTTSMVAGSDRRLAAIERLGIAPIDRRTFSDLEMHPARFDEDPYYRRRYLAAEFTFVKRVRELTGGRGVSIFIENIGTPVYRATMRALGTQGVIATCGWKHGSTLTIDRATECMTHRTHVFTHGCTHEQGLDAYRYAERHGWLPPVEEDEGAVYDWAAIPKLAEDFRGGRIESYFPIYRVNE